MQNQVVERSFDVDAATQADAEEFRFSSAPNLEEIRSAQMEFVRERNWESHHIPRNIMLSLVGEIGELAELFQWRKDKDCDVGLPGWSDADKEHLGQELSDVLIYLVDLAATCHVDLSKAVIKKMDMNKIKYPAKSTNNNTS